MELIRLFADDTLSLRLWPDVRERIIAATQMENPGADSNVIIQTIHSKWVTASNTIGIWAAVEKGHVLGHAVAWVETVWNVPRIFIFQIISDPQSGALFELKDEFLSRLREWIDYLNGMYAKSNSPFRIDYDVYFTTMHEQAFLRIFKGRAIKEYSTLRIDVSAQLVSAEVH